MRRRRAQGAPRTAQELVSLYARIVQDAQELEPQARAPYVRDAMRLHGTDPVEAIRARYWLRRGRADDGWRL